MHNTKAHLPDKKYYEFIYHKFFNPTVSYTEWKPWDQWDYPEKDLIRFKHIIVDNIDYIKDLKVLDVACHLGYLSLFCLHTGSKYVTGTNVREREIDLSQELCTIAGYNNFKFINLNLYDFVSMTTQLNQHDTVLLSGILYHVNNHYQLLEYITNSNIKNIIIESEVTDNNDQAIVNWVHENSEHRVNGFYNDLEELYVGIPSLKFLTELLRYFKWDIKSSVSFPFSSSTNRLHQRAVVVATRQG